MPQLSLYLDEPTMEMLREKSSRAHQSMSRYVTGLIRESGEGRGWPGRAVRQHRVRSARDLRFGRDRQPRVGLEGDEGRVGAVPWEREDL